MGTLPPGDREPTARCKALPAQRPHHPLGALGLALLQEGPLDLEIVGLCRGEQAVQVHGGGRGGGLFAWQTLPSALSPRTVPPGDPSLLRLLGCDTSPGPQGQKGTESAVLFSFFKKMFLNGSLQVTYIVMACTET